MTPRIDSRSADLLRSIALFLVVLLHAASPYFHDFNAAWGASVFYGSIARVCIPLFFMLSGALLLEKQEPAGRFFQRRASRILAPTLFWSLVYLFYRRYAMGQADASLNPVQMLQGPTYYHLWFMYAIIMAYLATPMLRAFHARSSDRSRIAVLILWFIACSILPAADVYAFDPQGFDLRFIPLYGGFMLLGALLARHAPKWRFSTAWALFLVATALTAAMTAWYSSRVMGPDEKFYDYLAPNVVLAATGAFILIAKAGTRLAPAAHALLRSLSRYTFGIYFLHVIILNILQGVWFTHWYAASINSMDALLIIPVQAVTTLLVSLMLIAMMQRLPALRKVT